MNDNTCQLNAAVERLVHSSRVKNVFPVCTASHIESIGQSELRETAWRNAFHAGGLSVRGQLTEAPCSWSVHRMPLTQCHCVFTSDNTYYRSQHQPTVRACCTYVWYKYKCRNSCSRPITDANKAKKNLLWEGYKFIMLLESAVIKNLLCNC